MATLTKSTGTVTLSGAVEKVAFPAVYGWVWVKNMSDSDMFLGLDDGVSAGADGVLSIPAGECGRIQTDGQDSVFLIGTGNALVVAQNYADCPFKLGGKGGEIPDLSAYAKTADVPNIKVNSAINADTVGGLHADEIASNPNLLINPDFKINQRGDNSYTSRSESKYTVDRWRIMGTCVPTSTGVTVSADNSAYNYGSFYQIIENYISNQDVTLSAKANGKIYHFTGNTSESGIGRINITDENGNDVGYVKITNNNVHNTVEFIILNGFQMEIEWVKLEYGSIATPFVSPEPITELLKCQRYYQVRSENNIAAVDLRPNMRDGVVPTITALADGNYSYSAEL